MTTVSRKKGFTQVDLLVMIVILAVVIALLMPSIIAAREAARRARCLNNMKILGLSFQNMESVLGRFPSSCRVRKDPATGKINAMGGVPGTGWSWCIDILPYIEHRVIWETLDILHGAPLDHYDDKAHPHTKALGTSIAEFICPSFGGQRHIDKATKFEAITNYKAMGATHIESLNVASTKPTTPLYGTAEEHPDGGIFPGSRHGINGFSADGSAFSMILVETKEQYRARWTVGREACLVGLPATDVGMSFETKYRFWHPKGFTANAWGNESTIPKEVNKTYLDWDYQKIPYKDGGVSKPSKSAKTGAVFYGPSSDHPGVANHAFADGSVHSISTSIDAAAYMFMITRDGGEPCGFWDPCD